MSLSFQKLSDILPAYPKGFRLNIVREEIAPLGESGEKVSIDSLWPGFSFLKALGFREIVFRSASPMILEQWTKRIEDYQQKYIEDPEYSGFDDFIWGEPDPDSDTPIIDCLKQSPFEERTSDRLKVIQLGLGPVPPMLAPLGVNAKALQSFRDEVENERPEDSLRRINALVEEYKSVQEQSLPPEWTHFLGSILQLSLSQRQLELASQMGRKYADDLRSIFSDDVWTTRLLEAYEPKAPEIKVWSEIFLGLTTKRAIDLLQRSLGTKAGTQLVKIVSTRASQDPESLANLCFSSPPEVQKILLQWLAPYWRPKHYPKILENLEASFLGKDFELINSWIHALLRSYAAQGLTDLKKHFQPKRFWNFLKSPQPSEAEAPNYILNALQEHRSAEILRFLKEIKPLTKGKSADQVEKLIHSFRERKLP